MEIRKRRRKSTERDRVYISVMHKFLISQTVAFLWVIFAIKLSLPWLSDLSNVVSFPLALFIITFLAYVPGYLLLFAAASIILYKQSVFEEARPSVPVTILIPLRNEVERMPTTLRCIANQEYEGEIYAVIVDNNSTDGSLQIAQKVAQEYGLNYTCLFEPKEGKSNALNRGLKAIKTEYFITVDADTLLHKKAVNNIVAKILSSPDDVCAVAGHVLVENSKDNLLTRVQEWDYFLAIAFIKKVQSLYQRTLVAQGAFSIHKTDVVREVGGWDDTMGEDIVLTWKYFLRNYKVYFEPMAVAFTEVPNRIRDYVRQRSRWARGMLEALKIAGPWKQKEFLAIFLTGIDVLIPFVDFSYTFFWLPGLILAFFGKYYIVGPYTALVLPLIVGVTAIMYISQKGVFDSLGLKIRKSRIGYVLYLLSYQLILSPSAIWGYIQEIFQLRRAWK